MTAPEQDAEEWRSALYGAPPTDCYEHQWRVDRRAGVLVCPVCGATEEP